MLFIPPAGAYTTARTVQGNLVFKLSSHVQRLATSANLMMDADMRVSQQHGLAAFTTAAAAAAV
jgi:branched-subunit amino acid aminotransferase/4-amino-4-deoxychorismate lyase